MNLILGIDCSTRRTNIGVAHFNKPVGEMNLALGRDQARELPNLVSTLLNYLKFDLADLDAVAVTVGPGYFTGIRVGLSYASALAEGLGIPVIPVCSIHAVAYESLKIWNTDIILPVIWGGRGSIYAGAFKNCNGTITNMLPVGTYSIPYIESFLAKHDKTIVVPSPDSERCSSLFPQYAHAFFCSPVSGNAVAMLGYSNSGKSSNPSEIRAMYYREPDIGIPKKVLL